MAKKYRQQNHTLVQLSIMNETNVSLKILERLTDELGALTPEARKAATYVLENPHDIGVSTVREIAQAAQVKPNTVVRMARQVGFDGYEDFRAPFREAIKNGNIGFPDRARWLQEIGKSGALGDLLADMLQSALDNLEETFARISATQLEAAAKAVWVSTHVYTLGVGINHANANNFTYLASTGMIQFRTIPRAGSTPIDDLAYANSEDTLIAITCKPYRREVVEAVALAKQQGMTIIGLSDSPASPILRDADFSFVLSTETPQFFPSSVSTIALLETLLSFVVALASDRIVTRVEQFHQRRHRLGIYHTTE